MITKKKAKSSPFYYAFLNDNDEVVKNFFVHITYEVEFTQQEEAEVQCELRDLAQREIHYKSYMSANDLVGFEFQ